mmetsp:Transcript_23688/g.31401  ORF Transcript_23688/g.31401 Transcript_23688/m.31401 type:complete len:91 (+) Transcript_23688:989-1261(+)
MRCAESLRRLEEQFLHTGKPARLTHSGGIVNMEAYGIFSHTSQLGARPNGSTLLSWCCSQAQTNSVRVESKRERGERNRFFFYYRHESEM